MNTTLLTDHSRDYDLDVFLKMMSQVRRGIDKKFKTDVEFDFKKEYDNFLWHYLTDSGTIAERNAAREEHYKGLEDEFYSMLWEVTKAKCTHAIACLKTEGLKDTHLHKMDNENQTLGIRTVKGALNEGEEDLSFCNFCSE